MQRELAGLLIERGQPEMLRDLQRQEFMPKALWQTCVLLDSHTPTSSLGYLGRFRQSQADGGSRFVAAVEQQLEAPVRFAQIVSMCRCDDSIAKPVIDVARGERPGEAVHGGRVLLPGHRPIARGGQILGVREQILLAIDVSSIQFCVCDQNQATGGMLLDPQPMAGLQMIDDFLKP